MKALDKAKPSKVGIYNVGTGKGCPPPSSLFESIFFKADIELISDEHPLLLTGRSVKEFVEACKKATGVDIKVDYLERRPGDYAEVYSDPSKINSELNWTAKYTDLHESLSIAWSWQKLHPNGYVSPSAVPV